MITIPESVLIKTCSIHTSQIKKIFDSKCEILNVCLEYYNRRSINSKNDFNSKINKFRINDNIKIQSINWFLKTSKKADDNNRFKISKITNTENFFKDKNRRFNISNTQLRDEIKQRIDYFSKNIELILSEKPRFIYDFSCKFNDSIKSNDARKISMGSIS